MTVQSRITAVDIIILAQIRHKVVSDKIQEQFTVDHEILIAHFLVGVGDIVAVIKADKYHRCSLAVLHAFSQLGTVTEAPYTVCQEENGIGPVLVVIGRERYVYSEFLAHFFVVNAYLVNGILYCFNGITVEFPVVSVVIESEPKIHMIISAIHRSFGKCLVIPAFQCIICTDIFKVFLKRLE